MRIKKPHTLPCIITFIIYSCSENPKGFPLVRFLFTTLVLTKTINHKQQSCASYKTTIKIPNFLKSKYDKSLSTCTSINQKQ